MIPYTYMKATKITYIRVRYLNKFKVWGLGVGLTTLPCKKENC